MLGARRDTFNETVVRFGSEKRTKPVKSAMRMYLFEKYLFILFENTFSFRCRKFKENV